LKARLSAALAINVESMRQGAVAAVAIDAAKAGNAEAAREALAHINVFKTLNRLRSECAIHLARAGKFEEAIAMAKTINVLALENRRVNFGAKRGDYFMRP
jgi:hypothetical protein